MQKRVYMDCNDVIRTSCVGAYNVMALIRTGPGAYNNFGVHPDRKQNKNNIPPPPLITITDEKAAASAYQEIRMTKVETLP